MNRIQFAAITCCGLIAASAARAEEILTRPMTVSGVSMSQDKDSQALTISYTLDATDPAFVRFEIVTNEFGDCLDSGVLKTISGDGYSPDTDVLIASGPHKIIWQAKKDWPEHLATNAQAKVIAYYATALSKIPGIYMVVDLSEGTNATSYPVSYTLTPPDPTDVTCCSNHLWLKRIETNTFAMGSADTEAGHQAKETLHNVTLTNTFFIGVFPVTQAQYALVMGSVPPSQSGTSQNMMLCPVNQVSYDMIRGATTNSINWPRTGTNVLATSFLGVLRSRTGGLVFDLPTEAQWECACRAGTTTAWNDGSTFSTNALGVEEHLENLGWYWSYDPQHRAGSPHPVGLKLKNAWNLYDFHGNVAEWCLDWRTTYGTDPVEEPVGIWSEQYRDNRGGSAFAPAFACRSPYRTESSPQTTYGGLGFRLACRLMP